MKESDVVRLAKVTLSERGARLFRNNSGATYDNRGNFIRYGLANESKAQNAIAKSGDLIGITPVVVTPEMVGQTVGLFTSVECKAEGWKFSPKDPHEQAQCNWMDLITGKGGLAYFCTVVDGKIKLITKEDL